MLFGRLKAIVQTLRFRLTAWVALVVFLVVSVTMLSVRAVVLRTIYTEFDQRLLQDMDDVRLAIKHYFPDKEPFYKAMNLKALGHLHVDWFVELFDAEGKLTWSIPNAPKLRPPQVSRTETKMRDEGSFRVVETRLEDPALAPMIIRLGSSRLSMDDDIALLNWIMVLASASILVLAPVSGYESQLNSIGR